MRSFVVICFFAMVALAVAAPNKKVLYTDRYDNIKLDEILQNPRLLHPYVECTLDLKRCSPEGTELKSHIKEALETRCAKCTQAQQQGSRRVIEHLINHEPDYWQKLADKYDPQRKFTKQYEQELRTVKH